jgi:hypothetical protein
MLHHPATGPYPWPVQSKSPFYDPFMQYPPTNRTLEFLDNGVTCEIWLTCIWIWRRKQCAFETSCFGKQWRWKQAKYTSVISPIQCYISKFQCRFSYYHFSSTFLPCVLHARPISPLPYVTQALCRPTLIMPLLITFLHRIFASKFSIFLVTWRFCLLVAVYRLFKISIWFNVFKIHIQAYILIGRTTQHIESYATVVVTAASPVLPLRSSYRRYRLFVSMTLNRDMRIAGCIVRAARRRVNKLRRKIWSRWNVQCKAGAQNYSRFWAVKIYSPHLHLVGILNTNNAVWIVITPSYQILEDVKVKRPFSVIKHQILKTYGGVLNVWLHSFLNVAIDWGDGTPQLDVEQGTVYTQV